MLRRNFNQFLASIPFISLPQFKTKKIELNDFEMEIIDNFCSEIIRWMRKNNLREKDIKKEFWCSFDGVTLSKSGKIGYIGQTIYNNGSILLLCSDIDKEYQNKINIDKVYFAKIIQESVRQAIKLYSDRGLETPIIIEIDKQLIITRNPRILNPKEMAYISGNW